MSATTCRKEVRGDDRVKKPRRIVFIDDTDVDTDDVPTDLEEEDRTSAHSPRRSAAKKAHRVVDEEPIDEYAFPGDELLDWTDEDMAFIRTFLAENEHLEPAPVVAIPPQTVEAAPMETPSTALLLGEPDPNETPELFPLKPEDSPESSSIRSEVRDRSVTFKWTVDGKSCEISVKL